LLARTEIFQQIQRVALPIDRFVAALGNISRDFCAVVGSESGAAFYCMGSMGSVIPLALGIALSRPELRITAIEGDGSLIMNLGCLLTLKKCGVSNLRAIILDNKCYESTGGQPSQPEDFSLASTIRSTGLRCFECEEEEEFERSLLATHQDEPIVIVVKTKASSPAPRISIPPAEIRDRFIQGLNSYRSTGKA
jgi:thiamine pyrophosphate-dependent acetolactate synthase large subunit-like protein